MQQRCDARRAHRSRDATTRVPDLHIRLDRQAQRRGQHASARWRTASRGCRTRIASTRNDVVLHKTPFGFDVSVWEFVWPLAIGAKLAIAAPGDHRDPARLVAAIEAHRVSTLHFVPSMLAAFVAHLDEFGDARAARASSESSQAAKRSRRNSSRASQGCCRTRGSTTSMARPKPPSTCRTGRAVRAMPKRLRADRSSDRESATACARCGVASGAARRHRRTVSRRRGTRARLSRACRR